MEKNNFKLFITFLVLFSLTIIGRNVLAVEVHQKKITSSNISHDYQSITTPQRDEITRKSPYIIYTGNNTEIQVLWQLHSTSPCTIEWGTDTSYSLGSAQTNEYGYNHQHTFTISNLTPGAKYYYRVNINGEIHTGSFFSASSTNAKAVKFLAYGDTRSYPAVHDSVAKAMIATYTADEAFQSFVLSVGDLVNSGDCDSDWDSQFFNPLYPNILEMLATLPIQSCRGNHEGNGSLFKRYFPYPYVDEHYWSFDYGPAHFTIVDQYTNYSPDSPQYNWINNDLATTNKPWKFICLHEPGWSAGHHGNNTDVQDYIQPLCEQYGVQIVFAGHNHYYARAEVNNVQHVTTAGGGAPLSEPDSNYPNIVTVTKAHHFCKIEINNDLLNCIVQTPDGTVIDSFSIIEESVNSVEQSNYVESPFVVYQNYPNPFNPTTTISFDLPEKQKVDLTIYNLKGQKVKTLLCHPELDEGRHTVTWDGNDSRGRQVASGVYLYKLKAGGYEKTRKMVLLK